MLLFSARTLLTAAAMFGTLTIGTGLLDAQTVTPKIPVRQLGPPLATSRDTMGVFVTLRALSDGRVIVNDVGHTRVMLLDSTLARGRVVIDTVGGNSPTSPARALDRNGHRLATMMGSGTARSTCAELS